jgi:ribosomal protein S18 acetylase RimI-like enzyme
MTSQIEVLEAVTAADVAAVRALMGQLSTRDPGDVEGKLQAVVQATDADAVVVRDEGEIAGLVIINVLHKVLGREGHIDELVVDEGHRGQGLAKKLMEQALRELKDRGCGSVELTSGERRVAANKLYPALGFERRDTNVYRLKF